MYARAVTLFARATRPLERVDGAVNRLNDLTVRLTPWVWWPAARPTRDRPLHAGQHAAYLGWSAFGFVAGELLARRLPEDQRPTGRRLRRERAATALLSVALWIVAAGAWDRRAARLRRRPWRR
jgi:hypothetical protein